MLLLTRICFTNRKADLHDVVSKLDRVTSDLNSLAEQIYSLQGQVDLLNYYESTLKVQEQLLLVMNKLVETEVSQMSLDSANYLASDLEARITRLNSGFASVRKTGKVNMDELLGRLPQKIKGKACYFCSRPISNATQSKTTVSDGGRERKVLACPVCLITIKETGTAKFCSLTSTAGKYIGLSTKTFCLIKNIGILIGLAEVRKNRGCH